MCRSEHVVIPSEVEESLLKGIPPRTALGRDDSIVLSLRFTYYHMGK